MRKIDFVLGTTHWNIMVNNYPVYRVNDNFFKIFAEYGQEELVDNIVLSAKTKYKHVKWIYKLGKKARILNSLTDEEWEEVRRVINRNYYGN